MLDTAGAAHAVWSGEDPSRPGGPADFVLRFAATAYQVAGVRLTVNTGHDQEAWEEIDAVRLLTGAAGGAGGRRGADAGHDRAAGRRHAGDAQRRRAAAEAGGPVGPVNSRPIVRPLPVPPNWAPRARRSAWRSGG